LKLSQAILIRTASALCATLLVLPCSYGQTTHSSNSGKSTSKSAHVSKASSKTSHHKRSKKSAKKSRGQKAIDSDRTREIQQALIREHYLDGEPSGTWDARTKAALTKFQADNGWQTKVLPDSRALIKLGLGPSKEGLLNPESAAIGNAHELGAEKAIPGGAEPHK